jgi:ABC-2 type transport system ATP-binding protein
VPAAIEANQLTRVFREPGRLLGRARGPATVALSEVSLCVADGECVALVGPNGAGKSTLLRVLATLVLPTAGEARVLGRDVVDEASAVRRAIGVTTGDDRSFFWRLSGFQNLVFFGQLQGLDYRTARARSVEILECVGLTAAADRRFAGYSTGMRQRLGIARALLHRPRVLLLDEPTANLDLEYRGRVLEMLRELLATGDVTALIASHDAGLAATLAERVIRLEGGQVVERDVARTPLRYLIHARGLTPQQAAALGAAAPHDDGSMPIEVADFGDGHALSAAIASVVAGGGEVLDVRALSRLEVVR